MVCVVVPATEQHVAFLAERLRETDRNEIKAITRRSPEEALKRSYERSAMAWTLELDGEPIVMFGVTPSQASSYIGIPWLLGTDKIHEAAKFVARHSKEYIEKMLSSFSFLYNWTDARNKIALRWLEWCGFFIEPPQPFGVEGKPFHSFWLRRDT